MKIFIFRACIQGHYSGEEWRELLHSKLIQLASTFGFKHYFTDGVLQIGSNFIRIDFNLHTLKVRVTSQADKNSNRLGNHKCSLQCFVAYAGEDFSECLKTGQYLLNQKWNEIQKSLTMILTLFSPSQSQDKLQTKYNQLKVSSSMFQRLHPNGPSNLLIDRPLSSTPFIFISFEPL